MDKETLDVGAASRPCPGFMDNGDRYYIKDFGSRYLISVIDGLGHGKSAAEASEKALECLALRKANALEGFYAICDKELIGSRGVVIGVAIIDTERDFIEYTGVGNIETQVYVGDSINTLISSYGIVGSGHLPHIKVRQSHFPPGALLVMFSDGISTRFRLHDYYGLIDQSAQFIADVIIRDWARTSDDATVVVIKRRSDNGN